MSQETPQGDATAAEVSVREASSNPVAAETATIASTEGNSKHTDTYASPTSAPLKPFRDRDQRRLSEKFRGSIDNKRVGGSNEKVRKHPEAVEASGSPLADTHSQKRKHQASIEDSDRPSASIPGRRSKYQASAEESGIPLACVPIRKGKHQATVDDAPSPSAPRKKLRSDEQELIMEEVADTGENSGLDGDVGDQDDKVEVPEIIIEQKFHGFGFDVLNGTSNPPARLPLTIHDAAIDVLGNAQRPTASPQAPGVVNNVVTATELVTAAAMETTSEKSPVPIKSRTGEISYGTDNNVLEDIQNKSPDAQPKIHDIALNVLNYVLDLREEAHSTDDHSGKEPLDAFDDTLNERDSLQLRIHDSKNRAFVNEAVFTTPEIEDPSMDFVGDALETSAGPGPTYHDSAVDVSNDTLNNTCNDIMKDVTSSPVRPSPMATTFATNISKEIQRPPVISCKKRKERADSTGLDGDDEASSTVRLPVSRGWSGKRPLRDFTINRPTEFRASSPERRKRLVSSRSRVDVEEQPSQHKCQASTLRPGQKLNGALNHTAYIDDSIVNLGFSLFENSPVYTPVTKRRETIPAVGIADSADKAPNEKKPDDGEDWVLDLDFSQYPKGVTGPYDDPNLKRAQHMALVPRIIVWNHSHPTLATVGVRFASPGSQQWYKLGMSLNVPDPGPNSGESSIRITHQLNGFEGVIEYKITACSPKTWPNPLNLTLEWGKVSDVDLARSTVPFHSTVEGWCDQSGRMHPYGNFIPSGTIKLKELTTPDRTCCAPSQIQVQTLRDPVGPKQRDEEEIGKAWKRQRKEYGRKHKGPINLQVISKHDDGEQDNKRPNSDPFPKRHCTKRRRRPTRYTSSVTAFDYCCLDISSEEESQEEPIPFRRPFQEIIGDYDDLDVIEPGDDDDYRVDFYTLPMTVPWPVQSEPGTDDDEARDGNPNRAWAMVCESMKSNLASSNGTSSETPDEGLTMVRDLQERWFNSSEDISDYFEDPDPNGDIAEDCNNQNVEIVSDGDEKEEQVMRLRGGALPEPHDEFGLDGNDLAAVESSEENYQAQEVSEDDGQSDVSEQNPAKRRKYDSGWGKGKVQRDGKSKANRKWDSRRRKRQSNGDKKGKGIQESDDNEQNDGNRNGCRPREADSDGDKESNSQITQAGGHRERSGESNGDTDGESNEQVEENIELPTDDPLDSPGQRAVDRMWEENAAENRARACRVGQECEEPFACWCEGMQEIEESNLW